MSYIQKGPFRDHFWAILTILMAIFTSYNVPTQPFYVLHFNKKAFWGLFLGYFGIFTLGDMRDNHIYG